MTELEILNKWWGEFDISGLIDGYSTISGSRTRYQRKCRNFVIIFSIARFGYGLKTLGDAELRTNLIDLLNMIKRKCNPARLIAQARMIGEFTNIAYTKKALHGNYTLTVSVGFYVYPK